MTPKHTLQEEAKARLTSLGIHPSALEAHCAQTLALISRSPIDGSQTARLLQNEPGQAGAIMDRAQRAFQSWRMVPAPRRGELIRLFGQQLRERKAELAWVVCVESGKIMSEALGEVQEMIDICDFAVGISRQLHGLTIASERPGHRMMETWHPLGPVVIISAFNFPAAVWAWNFALAIACGDPCVWKPSEKAPLTALACQALFESATREFGSCPEHLSQAAIGGAELGAALAAHPMAALVSATGSTAMGRKVGPLVASRFGRSLLELGGNNAVIAAPSADLSLALRGIVFGAAGTAGQRCTSTRRLIVHESIAADLIASLKAAYASLAVGDPMDPLTLVGPLIDQSADLAMKATLDECRSMGSEVFGGERLLQELHPYAFYRRPALAIHSAPSAAMRRETFAPILHIATYSSFAQAISMQNDSEHGLSSSIFTNDVREAEAFMGSQGSDCGIANVNIGTSGAEIGGAFGGEKHTGGGRESGSDSWRAYMRRATNTINYSSELPLAQGVLFG